MTISETVRQPLLAAIEAADSKSHEARRLGYWEVAADLERLVHDMTDLYADAIGIENRLTKGLTG